MSNLSGVVQFVSKSPKGFYSIKVDDVWYGFGRAKPPVDQGSEISCTFTTKGDFNMIDDGSLSVSETSVAPSAGTGAGKKAASDRDQYWTNKAETDKVQQRIRELHAARGMAAEVAKLVIDSGALKLPAAENKRYDVVLELVDSLTSRFYNEVTERFYATGVVADDLSKSEEE